MVRTGRHVLGAGAALLGAIGLAYGEFATVWQPVQDYTPARTFLAYTTALALLGAGLALQWRRSAGPAALVIAALHFAFALLWMPRIILVPQIFAVWAGFAEQFAVTAAAIIIYAAADGPEEPRRPRLAAACRIAFGICVISFGFNHFFNIPQTAAMVPAWIPPGQAQWAWATGLFDVLAGLAILTGLPAALAARLPAALAALLAARLLAVRLLAARLLAAMFLGFELLIWLPSLFNDPANHIAWAGNAVTLIEVGAALVIADHFARAARRPGSHDPDVAATS